MLLSRGLKLSLTHGPFVIKIANGPHHEEKWLSGPKEKVDIALV